MTKRFFSDSSYKNSSSVFQGNLLSAFSHLKKDDLILIGIILILIGDGCEDKELLIILGLLFISDKISLPDKLSKE